MKKTIITLIMVAIMVQMSWAGSSRVLSVNSAAYPDIRFKIKAEGDSIASLTLDMNTYNIAPGSYFYGIKTVPTTPDAAYAVTVTDSDGSPLCTASSRHTTDAENYACNGTTGKYEKVFSNISVAVGNLGAGSTIIEIDLIGP